MWEKGGNFNGTGKSYFAGCIANALMEREISMCMTNTFSYSLLDITKRNNLMT